MSSSVLLALARSGWRRRRGALLGLSGVLALGLGVAVTSMEAADRTERAYPNYLHRAEVADVVVNPSLNTDRADAVIASAPGVSGYASHSLMTATPDRGEPRTRGDLDIGATQVLFSGDGRFVTQDRPVVHRGRMIRDGLEAFVNVEMADALDLGVGDTVPLAFWGNNYDALDDSAPETLITPIGRSEARVVGIGVFADEVLVDGLYPRRRVLVTPEVASRFDCTPPHPAADDVRSIDQLTQALLPAACATSYRYYSLHVDDGDEGVGSVTAAFVERFAAENGDLPAALREANIGFEPIPTVTAAERQRVRRSLDPTVTALRLFGAAAGLSTLVVVLLGVTRLARRDAHEAAIWRDLGAASGLRAAAVALPVAAAAVLGLAGALTVGWVGSSLGPVASARAIEPAGRMGLSPTVVAVVGGAAVALLLGVLAVARAAVRPPSVVRASARPSRMTVPSTSPSLRLGVGAAIAGSGSRALLAASVVAVGAVGAVVVFSASLNGLVSRPERFGWPYDVAATLGYGYGEGTDHSAIATTLDRPEVERWGLAQISNILTVNGLTVPTVAGRPGFDDMALPLVEGELPMAEDEIALGARTALRLGLDVGDTAQVATPVGIREATVSGVVVLPAVGAFLAERTGLGTGALLSPAFLDETVSEYARDIGADPEELADELSGFVAIDLRADVDPRKFVADIADDLTTWSPVDAGAGAPFVYTDPVRPPAVANVAAMRAVPVALAAVLALSMAVGLAVTIAVATRARRRELAILRALGCVAGQLRATVRWQALTVVGIGLAVGGPLGVAAGRGAYRAFAEELGVRPDPLVPMSWTFAVAAVTITIGLLAAAAPGRRAARVPAAEALRHE